MPNTLKPVDLDALDSGGYMGLTCEETEKLIAYARSLEAELSQMRGGAERWRLDSEELEAFHMSMDKHAVPRATKFGVQMSAFGRAVKHAAMQSDTAPAAQQAMDTHPCTCNPADNPPTPCARKYAYTDCIKAAQQAQGEAVTRIEQLRKALFESRDAMRVMSNWVKKSDPAGHSWGVRMVDRANAVLGHEDASPAGHDAPGVLSDADRQIVRSALHEYQYRALDAAKKKSITPENRELVLGWAKRAGELKDHFAAPNPEREE